jgi:predicted RNase H-like nuclease (RuvC/YqgF family)
MNLFFNQDEIETTKLLRKHIESYQKDAESFDKRLKSQYSALADAQIEKRELTRKIEDLELKVLNLAQELRRMREIDDFLTSPKGYKVRTDIPRLRGLLNC